MKRSRFWSSGIRILAAMGWLLYAVAADAQNGENASLIQVPTLGGIGLGALAGVLAMAGAWAVSRNRKNKQ